MRFKWFAVLALIATPVFASPALFNKYETVRQGLLKNSLQDVKSSAKALATAATAEKNPIVAKAAEALAKSADMKVARENFGALSDEMIKVRNEAKGDRPAIAYCPMVKKSWLQSKKVDMGNPYEPAMKECGIFKSE